MPILNRVTVAALCAMLTLAAHAQAPEYDVIIRNGAIYDGSGSAPYTGDVAISRGRIVALGELARSRAITEIDAAGLAVAPGFINMLSWATESLIADGRSLGDIRQGITLEVFGEGVSMGPINETMRREDLADQADIRFDIDWTTLDQYMQSLVRRGVSPNVASFVGATTVRVHVLGYENRRPSRAELEQMRALVRQAMEQGAMGVGSSLIYAPAFYADTRELVELCKVAAQYGGMYITHMRSEGNRLLQGIDEVITIARDAGIAAEIYHLKAMGQRNWATLDQAIAKIEQARADGLRITADMYTYTAGATGLDACIPPWAHAGGRGAMVRRIRDPATRRRILQEMATPSDDWENLLLAAGSADRVLLVGFKSQALKALTGRTLAEVAAARRKSPEETILDLVVEDGSRVGAVYFMMSEENVRKQIAYPWVSFGSDAASMAPEGVFLKSSTHPRAYGNVARLLGKYVRDEKVIPLQEAIRRLTALPAANLKLKNRGRLAKNYFADIVIFDPKTIQDHATFQKPHQLATGVIHVFVNGVQVLKNGQHTGATPGQVIRGPGWKGRP